MKIDREAFKRGVDDMFTMRLLRWWLFKRISAFGWWICPEPQKSDLQSMLPTWDDFERAVARRLEGYANDCGE